MNIGKAIKLCRKQKNWTLAELADKSNLSTSYLSLLEQGKRDPNLSKLENIAKSLKIPLSVLLFLGTDKKEIESISPELAEKLSLTTLKLIEEL